MEFKHDCVFRDFQWDKSRLEDKREFRLAETEGACHDSWREDSDTENVIKLRFCEKKKQCKCAAESLWLFTLRRYNRGLSRFAILILLLLSVKLHYICSFSSKRSITFYFRCHVGNLTVLTRSWMWVTHNYIQCVFKHWVTWTLNEFLPLESNF